MHFEHITSKHHPMYEKARELYHISFPWHEQRESASQNAILGNEAYHFDLVYDGETFVGEVLYWEIADFLYIEHFWKSTRRRTKFPCAEKVFISGAALQRILFLMCIRLITKTLKGMNW